MSKVELKDISRIHFIGIGGIGMSALARCFLNEKKIVSGSDRAPSAITEALQKEGILFTDNQDGTIIYDSEKKGGKIEMVVYTEAMAQDHAEMVAAKALGVPMVNYFEALGLVANPYYLIAVSGTHGKTTTTAMLTDIFEANEKDPTVVVGSLRAKTQSNFRAGKSKYAIVEACEYKRDFLFLKPDVLVITNVEYEHTDYYKDLADVQDAFRTLALQVNEGGVVVANTKDPAITPIIAGLDNVIDYTELFDVKLSLLQPGIHNRLNAASALAVARHEKLSLDKSREALSEFTGTWRRFEYKGEFLGVPVYDDYAHHPTEIKATLEGVRELYPDKDITIVFEPHTFSRTGMLFDDFARAFAHADRVLLLPIYAAREANPDGISSRELAVKSLEYNKNVLYVPSYEDAIETLKDATKQNDVIVVLGAGNITKLAGELVAK